MKYATTTPALKKTMAADTKGMAYLRSEAFMPGVMNRQACQKMTGDEKNKPP